MRGNMREQTDSYRESPKRIIRREAKAAARLGKRLHLDFLKRNTAKKISAPVETERQSRRTREATVQCTQQCVGTCVRQVGLLSTAGVDS